MDIPSICRITDNKRYYTVITHTRRNIFQLHLWGTVFNYTSESNRWNVIHTCVNIRRQSVSLHVNVSITGTHLLSVWYIVKILYYRNPFIHCQKSLKLITSNWRFCLKFSLLMYKCISLSFSNGLVCVIPWNYSTNWLKLRLFSTVYISLVRFLCLLNLVIPKHT